MDRRELLRRLVALPFVGALATAIGGRANGEARGTGWFRGRSMILNRDAPIRAFPGSGTYRFKVVPGETIKKGDLVVVTSIGAGYLYGAFAFVHAY